MCDKHGIAWGMPQRLAGFIRALDGNKHLAMDFWSIVARMNDEDRGVGLEPNQVLEVVVEGVTGRSVAEVIVSGAVERRAVSDLTRLLAGEDLSSDRLSRDKDVQGSKDAESGEDFNGRSGSRFFSGE